MTNDSVNDSQLSPTPLFVNYVSSKSPAFILLHGDEDKKVPVSQSIVLKGLLDKNGVENELFIEEGARHSARVFDTEKYVPEVVSFVKRKLPLKRW